MARVLNLLNKGFPIIAYGAPNLNVFKSHAWNLDGYKQRKRTVSRYDKIYNLTQSEEVKVWIHCDYSWGGNSNGYFVSGIFNSKSDEAEYDRDHTNKFKYNLPLYIITYSSLN